MPKPLFVTIDSEGQLIPRGYGMEEATRYVAMELQKMGVPATFFIVGEYARRLEKTGPDAIRALRESDHDIGFHTNYHSRHPTVLECSIGKPYEEAVRAVEEQEISGIEDLRRIFSKPVVSYCRPGTHWSMPATDAMAKHGLNIFGDSFPGQVNRPVIINGIWHFPYQTSIEDVEGENGFFQSLDPEADNFLHINREWSSRSREKGLEATKNALREHYEKSDFVHLFAHECLGPAFCADVAFYKLGVTATPEEAMKRMQRSFITPGRYGYLNDFLELVRYAKEELGLELMTYRQFVERHKQTPPMHIDPREVAGLVTPNLDPVKLGDYWLSPAQQLYVMASGINAREANVQDFRAPMSDISDKENKIVGKITFESLCAETCLYMDAKSSVPPHVTSEVRANPKAILLACADHFKNGVRNDVALKNQDPQYPPFADDPSFRITDFRFADWPISDPDIDKTEGSKIEKKHFRNSLWSLRYVDL